MTELFRDINGKLSDGSATFCEATTGGDYTPPDPVFKVGDPVEKYTGEARWWGHVVAKYLTRRGAQRYVVEVEPQGFQMICTPGMLRQKTYSPAAPQDFANDYSKLTGWRAFIHRWLFEDRS